MNAKKLLSWMFIFGVLSAVTSWVLSPHDGIEEALAYDEGYRHAIVMPREQLIESIWQRIVSRLVQRELVCPVNDEQFAYLAGRYDVTTEEVKIGGDTVTLLKIDREGARRSEIMRYLRQENRPLRCTAVPARSWYYLVFTGTVS